MELLTKCKGWEGPRWLWELEHGEWKVGGRLDFEPQTSKSSLGKRKGERSALNHFASKNCQQRVDWFSHMPPFRVFCHFLILPRFQHILNPQNCFVSKGATQNSSLSFSFRHRSLAVHLECFPAWLRGLSASVQPGSEPVCIWADPLSPCQKGLRTDNNLCEPIFLPLIGWAPGSSLS